MRLRLTSRCLCLLAVVSAACARGQATQPPGLRVLAAETFLADMAQNVAGTRVTVESLLKPGIDPHEFQATPQDAIRISQANVLIVNGRGYETWLQNALAASDGQLVVAEATTGLLSAAGEDPHLWMSPLNAVQYVQNIREVLTQADPAGSDQYEANASAYTRQLQQLDAWITQEVSSLPAERRILVTNHHALESFANAYGFQIAGVVIPGYTSEAAPSAQAMADLIQTIRATRAPAIFLDVSEKTDLAQQLARESGAKVVTGLYVETLSEPDGPAPSYIAMMKYDVGLIVEALR